MNTEVDTMQNETDMIEIACLYCGKKMYIDPTSRSFHNFCDDRCENKWRDIYAELVDTVTVSP